MRNRKPNRQDTAAVDLTPMLDVVFILLIFFIVTSTFIQEDAIGLEPPPPMTGGDEEGFTALIYVRADGVITLNNRLTPLGNIQAGLERLQAEAPETPLIIQADQTAPTGHIIRIRDAAYNAGVQRVNLVRSKD